jgi:hypothetical protein
VSFPLAECEDWLTTDKIWLAKSLFLLATIIGQILTKRKSYYVCSTKFSRRLTFLLVWWMEKYVGLTECSFYMRRSL